MIGILASRTAPDPDGQHGTALAGRLEALGIDPPPVVHFEDLAAEEAAARELDRFQGLWWLHTAGPELPEAALLEEVRARVRAYLDAGGKLFLGRTAARYVEALGLDAGPDRYRSMPRPFYLRPGVHLEAEGHPLTEGLHRRLVTFGRIDMAAFSDLAWVEAKPARGLLLGTGLWNGAHLRNEGIFYEWPLGRGRVAAFSGAALHLYDHADRYRSALAALVRRIRAWLEAPCFLALRRGEGTAPAGHPERWEAARLGRAGLAFAREGEGTVEAVFTPFRHEGAKVRLAVAGGTGLEAGLVEARTPDPRAGERTGERVYILPLDLEELEEGYYTLEARVLEGGTVLGEVRAPLLVRSRESPRTWTCRALARIEGGGAALEVETASGCAKGLYAAGREEGPNFLANETNNPRLAGAARAPWFGTVHARVRKPGETAWRTVSNRDAPARYQAACAGTASWIRFGSEPPGAPLAFTWTFHGLADRLRWSFSLENRGDGPLEVGGLFLPATLDTYFGTEGDQARTYRKRVMMHNLACGRGSYLFAEPLCGEPPFLFVLPRFDEGFELLWHDRGEFAGKQPEWEGLLYAGIHTVAVREEFAAPSWFLGHTAARLAPGETRTFDLDLFLVDRYEAVEEILVREGFPALTPHPGMVVPLDQPAEFRVRSRLPFRVEAEGGLHVEEIARGKDGTRYRARFDHAGAYAVRVVTEQGRSQYLFHAIPPVETLVRARAAFIVKHQQYRNPASARHCAFLMWDAEEEALVTDPPRPYLAGGSDEAGFADPLFLSAKQIFFPDAREAHALEAYVETFLLGKVQDPEHFGVRRWVAEAGITDTETEGYDIGAWTDRSFNYPHVFNLHYFLYAAGRRYRGLYGGDPRTFLERAARTALAYLTRPHCLNAAVEQGNPGDGGLLAIREALTAEGLEPLRHDLDRALAPKLRHLCEAPFPFASEYAFDTTGYEGVYWMREAAGDRAGMERVLSVITATRGKQPFWYHYGGDVRWGWGNSKYASPDEICFNYMCALNGRVLLHAYREVRPEPWWLRLGFAGVTAPWVLVREDGAARDFCGWEPGRVRFDPWSSESGLGLAFTLLGLESVVVLEKGGGLVPFGCTVEEEREVLAVHPRDGVRRHVSIRAAGGPGIRITADRAAIRSLRLDRKTARLEVELERVWPAAASCTLRVHRLQSGGPCGPIVEKAEAPAPGTAAFDVAGVWAVSRAGG